RPGDARAVGHVCDAPPSDGGRRGVRPPVLRLGGAGPGASGGGRPPPPPSPRGPRGASPLSGGGPPGRGGGAGACRPEPPAPAPRNPPHRRADAAPLAWAEEARRKRAPRQNSIARHASGSTNTLPSPMRPVRAARATCSTTASTRSAGTHTVISTFGRN